MVELIVSLLSGAVGGNVAGNLLKNQSLGTLWNSVVGILGGGLGSQILGMLGVMSGGDGATMDVGSILANVASSGVGGGALLAIIGAVKNMVAK